MGLNRTIGWGSEARILIPNPVDELVDEPVSENGQ
jgi:hypothetical protein